MLKRDLDDVLMKPHCQLHEILLSTKSAADMDTASHSVSQESVSNSVLDVTRDLEMFIVM